MQVWRALGAALGARRLGPGRVRRARGPPRLQAAKAPPDLIDAGQGHSPHPRCGCRYEFDERDWEVDRSMRRQYANICRRMPPTSLRAELLARLL